jgi:hypothetical protein
VMRAITLELNGMTRKTSGTNLWSNLSPVSTRSSWSDPAIDQRSIQWAELRARSVGRHSPSVDSPSVVMVWPSKMRTRGPPPGKLALS